MHGFDGICRMAELMTDAYLKTKDTRNLIQIKDWVWMLLMRQTASIISTYTADVSGICSALFELGGLTVMHDASGCNSTYNTHDEPRWYDMDSMVYISGLSEMEAIMGDDDKLINDIVSTAEQLSPGL